MLYDSLWVLTNWFLTVINPFVSLSVDNEMCELHQQFIALICIACHKMKTFVSLKTVFIFADTVFRIWIMWITHIKIELDKMIEVIHVKEFEFMIKNMR